MQYRIDPKSGNKLSILGFGCMRFPRNLGRIDMEKTEKLILDAYAKGINYYDTAYLYMGSEEALGEILYKHQLREKVYIATKLPIMNIKTYEDLDRLFNIQLEHLKTDYIDYYFMHALSDMKNWERLCGLGIERWIDEKKAQGKIRQVGFSFHGTSHDFDALLEGYAWDFVQIQYNYVNTHYQAGTAGLKKAASMGLPVLIMEPLLGGKLASGLSARSVALMKQVIPSISPAAWSLRWLWHQEEVTVVLSGMNDPAQLDENVATAESMMPGALTSEELTVIDQVVDIFKEDYKIPCTGCNYCMPCPQNINIPACFSSYNISFAVSKFSGIQQYLTSTSALQPGKKASASDCIQCRKCEKHCPQHIEISKEMMVVKKRMEPLYIRGALKIISAVMSR